MLDHIRTLSASEAWADIPTDWLDNAYPLSGSRIPPAAHTARLMHQPVTRIQQAYRILMERGRVTHDERRRWYTTFGPTSGAKGGDQ